MQSPLVFCLRKNDANDLDVILSVCNLLSPFEVVCLLNRYQPCAGENPLPKSFSKAVEALSCKYKQSGFTNGKITNTNGHAIPIAASKNPLLSLENNHIYEELRLSELINLLAKATL